MARYFCQEMESEEPTQSDPEPPIHLIANIPKGDEYEYKKKFFEKPLGINIVKKPGDALYVHDSAWRDIQAGARFLRVEYLDKDDKVKVVDILPFPHGLKALKNAKTPCTIIFAVQDKVQEIEEDESDEEFWESLEMTERVNEEGEVEKVSNPSHWWKKGSEKRWLANVDRKGEESSLIPMEQERAELTRFLTAIGLEEHIDRFHSMTQLVLCKTYDLMSLEISIQHRRKIMRGVKHWLQYQNVVKYGAMPYMNADGTRSHSPSVGQHHGEIKYERQYDITAEKPAPTHLQFVWFSPEYPELDWYPPEYRPHWVVPIAPRKTTMY